MNTFIDGRHMAAEQGQHRCCWRICGCAVYPNSVGRFEVEIDCGAVHKQLYCGGWDRTGLVRKQVSPAPWWNSLFPGIPCLLLPGLFGSSW